MAKDQWFAIRMREQVEHYDEPGGAVSHISCDDCRGEFQYDDLRVYRDDQLLRAGKPPADASAPAPKGSPSP